MSKSIRTTFITIANPEIEDQMASTSKSTTRRVSINLDNKSNEPHPEPQSTTLSKQRPDLVRIRDDYPKAKIKPRIPGECENASHPMLYQKDPIWKFGPFTEKHFTNEKDLPNIEESDTLYCYQVDRDVLPLYLNQRSDDSIQKLLEYYSRDASPEVRVWFRKLHQFYDEDIVKDSRVGIRYGGLMFLNAQIDKFYEKDGVADQLIECDESLKDKYRRLRGLPINGSGL